MDGAHAGKMSEWFDKEQPIYIEMDLVWGNL